MLKQETSRQKFHRVSCEVMQEIDLLDYLPFLIDVRGDHMEKVSEAAVEKFGQWIERCCSHAQRYSYETNHINIKDILRAMSYDGLPIPLSLAKELCKKITVLLKKKICYTEVPDFSQKLSTIEKRDAEGNILESADWYATKKVYLVTMSVH